MAVGGSGMLNLLAQAVGSLQDAVIITQGERGLDGQRRIIFVNKAFTDMTGFDESEVLGNTPDITIGPESDRAALQKIQEARDALVPVRVELIKYRKDKTMFWAELDVVPVLDDKKKCTHFLGVMRDVTERRAAHTKLLEQDRFAQIGTLAAGVAHEINNPLAYVLMNLSFLEEELPSLIATSREPSSSRWAEMSRALNEMRAGATRVARIVHDIQDFSRTDTPTRAGPCEIPPLLDRAIQMACTGLPARSQVVCLYNGDGDEDLPLVAADAARLSQVFLNLLINAIDAIPESETDTRRVEVKSFRQGPSVVVEFRDDGVGIAPEILPRIFDPFFTTKDVGHGMGLGLSISRSIVQGLGGMMIVESTVNIGTVVRVTLPIVKEERKRQQEHKQPQVGDTGLRRKAADPAAAATAAAAAARELPPHADERPTPTSEAATTRGVRVLIIDDELPIGHSLQRAIVEVGDEVVVCERAHAALALLEEGRDFQLILCDLSMPGMTGAELYDRIATRWPGMERKIVIMTGGASSDATRTFLERPYIRRIDKPIDLNALRAMLHRLRNRTKHASGVHEAPEIALLRLTAKR